MIRKIVIVLLTLAAVGTLLFGLRTGLGTSYRSWVNPNVA